MDFNGYLTEHLRLRIDEIINEVTSYTWQNSYQHIFRILTVVFTSKNVSTKLYICV